MGIILGSARHDEFGNIAFGKAGDQDGTEVSKQDFYVHSKGWYILRAIDLDVATKIAYAMNAACDNDNIGYDQNERDTLYAAAKPLGFDPMRVTKKVETDCSALVRVCVNYAGIPVGDFYTGNLADVLMSTGHFNKISYSSGTPIYNGDILVTKTKGHTVVVVSGAPRAAYTIGWHLDSIGWWYAYDIAKGSYYKNCIAQIDGDYYAFDDRGYMLENSAKITMNEEGAITGVYK